ncbi:hypothetical protein FRC17_007560 [Serendipita sp. 399]|nr:hypothetical protein FRC17_007560 [Serendipita sp. 399]
MPATEWEYKLRTGLKYLDSSALFTFLPRPITLKMEAQTAQKKPSSEDNDDVLMSPILSNTICYSIIEIGVSFGDGRKGAWSLWIAPTAGILSFFLGCFFFTTDDKLTECKRENKPIPARIKHLGVTCGIPSALLAVMWLVACIITFTRLKHSDVKPPRAAYAEAAFTVINMVLMAAQTLLSFVVAGQITRPRATNSTSTNNNNAVTNGGSDAQYPTSLQPQGPHPALQFPPQPNPTYNPVAPPGHIGNPSYATEFPYTTINPVNPITPNYRNPVYQPPDVVMAQMMPR